MFRLLAFVPLFVSWYLLSASTETLAAKFCKPGEFNGDAADLAPDGNYYFFTGLYFYTANKITHAPTAPQLITSIFATVVPPVIAAFSTGPIKGRMFIIDSATPNNVKQYNLDSSTIPRIPEKTDALNKFFAGADEFPKPLTAAATSFKPPRVYFFGGPPGNRQVATNSFSALSTTFGSSSTLSRTLASQWDSDITVATQYVIPDTLVMSPSLFVFDSKSAAEIDTNLKVVNGPVSVSSGAAWLPKVISQTCAILDATTAAPTTMPTTTPTTTTKKTLTTLSTTTTTTTPTTSTTTPTTTTTTPTITTTSTTPTTTSTTTTKKPTTTTPTTSITTTPTTTTTTPTTTTTTPTTTTTTPTTTTTTPTTTTTTPSTTTSTTPTTTIFTTTPTTTTIPTTTTATTSTTTTSTTPTTTAATTSKPEPEDDDGDVDCDSTEDDDECCCESDCDQEEYGSRLNLLGGWSATAKDEVVALMGTARTDRDCLRRCQTVNGQCQFVSFNVNDLSCVGFTVKALPVFKRDSETVLLAATDKVIHEVDNLPCRGAGIQEGAGEKVQVEGARNSEDCRLLCIVHPRCVHAELLQNTCVLSVCKSL